MKIEIQAPHDLDMLLVALRELLKERHKIALSHVEEYQAVRAMQQQVGHPGGSRPMLTFVEPTMEDVVLRALSIGTRSMIHALTQPSQIQPAPVYQPPRDEESWVFVKKISEEPGDTTKN